VPTYTAEQLRARARSLRGIAAQLAESGALTLHERAGEDTWAGPVAAHCRDDLLAVRHEVLAARDELLVAARALERQATNAETAALAARRVA